MRLKGVGELLRASRGVPQGSVLGPFLLFSRGPCSKSLFKLAVILLCLGKTCSAAFNIKLLLRMYWGKKRTCKNVPLCGSILARGGPVHIVARLRRSSWMSLDNLWGISLHWERTSECILLYGKTQIHVFSLGNKRESECLLDLFDYGKHLECASFLSSHSSIPMQ